MPRPIIALKALSDKIIWSFRKLAIFPRLAIVFLVLVILPALFITFFSFNQYVTEIEDNMEGIISLLVQNVTTQVDDRLEQLEKNALRFYTDNRILTALSENEQITMEQREQTGNLQKRYQENLRIVGQMLNNLASENRHVVNLLFITPEEQYFMINQYGYRRGGCIRDIHRFLGSSYYMEAVKNKGYPVWSDTTAGTEVFYRNDCSVYGLTDCITMSVAVYHPGDRKLIGVLVYNIDVRFFTDSMTNYSFYGGGNTFLVGKFGTILGVNSSTSQPNLSQQQEVIPLMRQKQYGTYNGRLGGVNAFLSFRRISKADIYVAHIVNKDMLLEPSYRIRGLCLILVAFLIVISVLWAYWTTISIVHPLKQLMDTMRSFVNDKFDARYKVTGKDEISALGKTFNEMADNTKKLVEQVYISDIKQKALELSKTNAELNALQMQINPHFLYNTLDIIRWEALYEAGGECKVSIMIEDFCCLMRLSIKSGADIVPISEELKHAETYINVVNFRHQEKIQLKINMKFEPKNCCIPKLTLQPLMENAVLHAFDTELTTREISIKGWLEQEDIIITVEDNGKGMTEEELQNLRSSFTEGETTKKSIGLRNVNQRLILYFGNDYGLKLVSECGKGTVIQIRLPQKPSAQSFIVGG